MWRHGIQVGLRVYSQRFEEHLMDGEFLQKKKNWTHRWTARSVLAWGPRGSGWPWRSWGSLCSRLTLLRDLELQSERAGVDISTLAMPDTPALSTRQRSAEEEEEGWETKVSWAARQAVPTPDHLSL